MDVWSVVMQPSLKPHCIGAEQLLSITVYLFWDGQFYDKNSYYRLPLIHTLNVYFSSLMSIVCSSLWCIMKYVVIFILIKTGYTIVF